MLQRLYCNSMVLSLENIKGRCRGTIRVALRPDAVQGRRRRPAKWNWKRFFRRIDRIRLYKKEDTIIRVKLPRDVFCLTFPPFRTECAAEKKRPKLLFVCSLGVKKKTVGNEKLRKQLGSRSDVWAARTRCPWNLSSRRLAEGKSTNFQQGRGRVGATRRRRRAARQLPVSWRAEETFLEAGGGHLSGRFSRRSSSKERRRNRPSRWIRSKKHSADRQIERWVVVAVVGRGGWGSFTPPLISRIWCRWASKDESKNTQLGTELQGNWIKCTLRLFNSKTSPGNLVESRQQSQRKTKRKLSKVKKWKEKGEKKKNHTDFLQSVPSEKMSQHFF